MKKLLSRLLIFGEVVVLIGILLIGLVGGIGTLGGYLVEKVSSWRSSRTEKAAENPENNQKVSVTPSETEDTSSEESLLAEVDTEADTEKTSETAEPEVSDSEKAVYTESLVAFSADVEEQIAAMTPEQKAAQVFLVNTEELMDIHDANKAGSTTESYYKKYPVGGIILLKDNCEYETQLVEFTVALQKLARKYSGVDMFIACQEIGGEDASILATAMETDQPASPSELGKEDVSAVTETAEAKADYLSRAGFNLNLGTMTSLTGKGNSYGTDPTLVSEMVTADLQAMQSGGVTSAVCTFPWSDTRKDTSSLETLMAKDLSVFQAAVDGGARVIIVGDDTVPAISGSDPCVISTGTADVLRGNMGYEGVLMTCCLSESSLKDQDSGTVAVEALTAGMDMIYSPTDLDTAYNAVLDAINDGTISAIRIHNALGRILTAKEELQEE